MKITHWLMITCLVVMILPLVAFAALFGLLQSYDETKGLAEYMDVMKRLSEVEQVIESPSLYHIQPQDKFLTVSRAASHSLKITLYRADGVQVFTSMENRLLPSIYRVNPEQLYENLYKLEQSHDTYMVKKPVFEKGTLIGFYEITMVREQWLNAFQYRTYTVIGCAVLFFIALYGGALVVIQRKLNQPMKQLMRQMTAFARNEPVPDMGRTTKDEMGALIAHFHGMKEQIEQARGQIAAEQRERDYMIASLSHDLKTPLTSIRAYAESLQQDKQVTEEEKREYFDIMFDKIGYMQQMLDDLATYTALRTSERGNEQERVFVDGEELFDMLFSGYDAICAQRSIHLEVSNEVSGVYPFHAKQMVRLTDNLMGNAIRYTPCEQRIWLGAFSENQALPEWLFPEFADSVQAWRGNSLVLLVQNEGEPIAPQDLEKLFQPFYQADRARTKSHTGGSSGLGLSIASMIAERHGGCIGVWSAAPHGTLLACRFSSERESEIEEG
ncbi:HAMP domain-containing histidine kinase [Paenibacillus alvei]|uniref:HAMP domain-containing sensor histidine kinase n=1 Tax=Paenibacillus alvei TaxID=44250 RepID=UPI000289D939|nr:HAMP domain-containing sensor histidine kinase [Paenibacillus alvei]EJW19549.1 integral membrane sensor signal transduction histidine kinase [Paenibacillus alvei DSM 29]MCY9541370.1 HAMP domain-containing histidine kinase [Paenibacillus alvei]MCY9702723.1 HAMP domain-containing histidine kinase [Paenibacillus alvei]MCY9733107.1 HAMP domain-containing histidine kinase [Paenibacillus alvei]MCY9756405.1 HAMP domain-containing histidine kinase [Paenibacillus alvei]